MPDDLIFALTDGIIFALCWLLKQQTLSSGKIVVK